MKRLLTAAGIAALLTINVAQGATGAVPFEAYKAEVTALRSAISFQVTVAQAQADGSEGRDKELLRLRDIASDGMAELESISVDACYQWYADTIIVSLAVYIDVVQADLDKRHAPQEVAATSATLRAADAMAPIIAKECSDLMAPIPPEAPSLINALA